MLDQNTDDKQCHEFLRSYLFDHEYRVEIDRNSTSDQYSDTVQIIATVNYYSANAWSCSFLTALQYGTI
jgi:hypothetical protein